MLGTKYYMSALNLVFGGMEDSYGVLGEKKNTYSESETERHAAY